MDKRQLKIIHICITYIDYYNYQENELSKLHARAGHKVVMISTQDYAGALDFNIEKEPIKSSIPYYIDNVKIIRLPLKYKTNFRFSILKGLYNTIETEKPDIIYFHGGANINLPIVSRYKINNPSCFVCMDLHAEYYNSGRNILSRIYHKYFLRNIIKRSLNIIDKIYYTTPLVAKFSEEMYNIPKNKLRMLQMGCDLSLINYDQKYEFRDMICNKYFINNDDIIIVTGGRINPDKNTINLIKAFNNIKNNRLHLLIVGNIVKDYIEELLKSIGNNERIHLEGWVDPMELNRYFLGSDLACFPGGQSILWQQAICCGLPLLIKYYWGIEYLNFGGNLHYIYKDDAHSIKMALEGVINDPVLLQSMARAAENGRNYLSYENIAQSIIDDYLEIKNEIF